MAPTLAALAALAQLLALARASVYPVASSFWVPPFQRAEKMFATDHGPVFAHAGNSTVSVDVSGVNVTRGMDGWRLVVFFYHVDSYDAFATVEDKIELLACSQEAITFDGMTGVEKRVFEVQNGSLAASAQHLVTVAGWTDTQIFVCTGDEDANAEDLAFEGTMEIRNPYGLLPAVLYGMLPFSGLLAVGYVVLDLFFAVLLVRFRKEIIQLHYGILLILVMGTASTSVWFYAFYRMNLTGEPVCCPYPTIFLVSVIMDVRTPVAPSTVAL